MRIQSIKNKFLRIFTMNILLLISYTFIYVHFWFLKVHTSAFDDLNLEIFQNPMMKFHMATGYWFVLLALLTNTAQSHFTRSTSGCIARDYSSSEIFSR